MIAVMNQKGGVGKTTTAANLSHAMALSGKRVLVVDFDPQAHLSASMGLTPRGQRGMDVVMRGQSDLSDVTVHTRERLYLVPAGDALADVERAGAQQDGAMERLKLALGAVRDQFDVVIIDCPPSAGVLGLNALLAADELLIPVSSDYLALHGLSRFMGIIKRVEAATGRALRQHIVVTRYQERRRLAREVHEKLAAHFPALLARTVIREAVALAECPSYGESIFEYRPRSNGADDYRALADELLTERVH